MYLFIYQILLDGLRAEAVRILGRFREGSSETKVTDSYLAVFVHQNVPRLEVSVNDVSSRQKV